MSEWPPPEATIPTDPPRGPSKPGVRTIALVVGVLLAGVAILRIAYRAALHRESCELTDPQRGVVRDAACRNGQRFHDVLDSWFGVVGLALGSVMILVLFMVPVISRHLDPPDDELTSPARP